jgi:hypothetical protein
LSTSSAANKTFPWKTTTPSSSPLPKRSSSFLTPGSRHTGYRVPHPLCPGARKLAQTVRVFFVIPRICDFFLHERKAVTPQETDSITATAITPGAGSLRALCDASAR